MPDHIAGACRKAAPLAATTTAVKPREPAARIPVLASSLMPAEFRRRVPEITLVAAVLENAVRSLERQNGGVTREQVEETLTWIDSDREDWPFAFVNVCEILGMNASRVRKNLRAVGLSNLEERDAREPDDDASENRARITRRDHSAAARAAS